MKKLQNKVAVITGGSSGIGYATAKLLLEEGAKVVIIGRDPYKLDMAFREFGGNITAIKADISSVREITAAIDEIKEAYGQIDILFANAGMFDCTPVFETDETFFDHLMDTNVKGVFFLFTKAFPLLTEKASVIFTSSVVHNKGRSGDPLYAATKAAVKSLARTLAVDEEVLAKKIRINVVSPGAIQTPLTQQVSPELEKMIDDYIKETVWGQADEIAKAVLFLTSSYTTGSEIVIDGD